MLPYTSRGPLLEVTRGAFQDQGACIWLYRDQRSRKLLSFVQRLGQKCAPHSPLAKNAYFSNPDGAARLPLFILERNVFNTEA